MTEALTGGFDSCLELAASFVDLQAEPGVATAVQNLQNLVLPLTAGAPLAGSVRMLFSRADVLPAGDFNNGQLTVQLIGTLGLEITAPSTDRLAFGAYVTISGLPLVLAPPATRDGQTQSVFAVGLSTFTVQVQADAASYQGLLDLAGRLGVSADAVTSAVASTLQTDLATFLTSTNQAGSVIAIPAPVFQFSPAGQDGRLGQVQSQTFLTGIALATRARTGGNPAVLCVFSNLFDARASAGDPAAKTAVATTIDASGAVIITALAAERFVLCPSALRALLPLYLNEALPGSILDGLQPSDIPGFANADPGTTQDLATAIQKRQVGTFFDMVLPAGLPPVSFQSSLGAPLWDRLPGRIRALLADTDAAMTQILPSQCGGASALPLPYSRLTSLKLGLTTDNITLAGVIEPHVWGIDGSVRFSTSLFAAVQIDGTVKLTASPPVLDSSIELEWYAVVLIAFAAAAIFAAITAFAGGAGGALGVAGAALSGAVAGTVAALTVGVELISELALNLINSQLTQVLGNLAPPVLPLPNQAVPSAITISPDGMILWLGLAAGTPAFPPPLPVPVPTLTMSEQSMQSTPLLVGSGKMTIESQCVNGTFSYQDFNLTTEVIFNVQPAGLTAPLSYQWTIDGFPIQGPYGLLQSTDPTQDTHYAFNSNLTQLVLLNLPGSPSYSRLVQCVATGADGISAQAKGGALFTGFERVFDPSYGQALSKCLSALIGELRQFGEQPVSGNDTGPVTAAELAALIASLIPGGEGDPRAGSLGLLAAALHMGDLGGMAAARQAIAQAARGEPGGDASSAGLAP